MTVRPGDVLRGDGRFAPTADHVPVRALLAVVVVAGFAQGAVMGFHDGRAMQSLYSGIKVPLLLLTATAICLPSFYVLHVVLGLHRDFAAACRGTFVAQATAALFLASCAPLIAFAYVSSDDYPFATFVNGVFYLGAALVAQLKLSHHYRQLISRDPLHRVTLAVWLVLYVFVAIQCAWTMRPFIGWPQVEPTLFREEAWGNAYVRLFEAVGKLFRR